MKRLLALGLILLVFMFVVACGKKEVKKPTPDSLTTLNAYEVTENLRQAYIKNDRDLLERNTTKLGYVNIAGGRKHFDSVDMSFTPMMVEIYGDVVHVFVSWNGTWKRGDNTLEDRGLAVFVMKEKPLKLDNILRISPFNKPE